MRGADLSLVVVGRSFTVAKGFVPLKQEGEEGCKQANYRQSLLPGAANVSSPFFSPMQDLEGQHTPQDYY